MSLTDLLSATIAQLDRAKVPYMITGSVASSYHGEPRATRDLDLVIDPDSIGLARLVDGLQAAGLYVDLNVALDALGRRSQFNAIDAATGWKIDFMIRKDRPFSTEEFTRRTRADLLGTTAWIASTEDTIVAKLEWSVQSGSDRQLRDVAAMLEVSGGSVDLAYLDRWITDLGLEEAWAEARGLRSSE